jgi:hypothetical protein
MVYQKKKKILTCSKSIKKLNRTRIELCRIHVVSSILFRKSTIGRSNLIQNVVYASMTVMRKELHLTLEQGELCSDMLCLTTTVYKMGMNINQIDANAICTKK